MDGSLVLYVSPIGDRLPQIPMYLFALYGTLRQSLSATIVKTPNKMFTNAGAPDLYVQ